MNVNDVKVQIRCDAPFCTQLAAFSLGGENIPHAIRIHLCLSCAKNISASLIEKMKSQQTKSKATAKPKK